MRRARAKRQTGAELREPPRSRRNEQDSGHYTRRALGCRLPTTGRRADPPTRRERRRALGVARRGGPARNSARSRHIIAVMSAEHSEAYGRRRRTRHNRQLYDDGGGSPRLDGRRGGAVAAECGGGLRHACFRRASAFLRYGRMTAASGRGGTISPPFPRRTAKLLRFGLSRAYVRPKVGALPSGDVRPPRASGRRA